MVFHLQSVNKATNDVLEEPHLTMAKKAGKSKSEFKAVMLVFFDIHGIAYMGCLKVKLIITTIPQSINDAT